MIERTRLAWLRRQRRKALLSAQGPLAELLATPIADRALSEPAHLLAVDLEMTGLDPGRDVILSAGWVPVYGRRIIVGEARHEIARTTAPVGQSAAIHQLRDCDVAVGAPLAEVLGTLLLAMRDATLLLHGGVDVPFLERACCEHFGASLVVPVIDTATLELQRRTRRQSPVESGDLRLAALRRQYHLPPHQAHNALSDALATAELYLAMTA